MIKSLQLDRCLFLVTKIPIINFLFAFVLITYINHKVKKLDWESILDTIL